MKPQRTRYRLMEEMDKPILERIWKDNRKVLGKPLPLDFPTVVAERDGRLLGGITTNKQSGTISMALIVAPPCAFMTFIRLFEAYENVLRYAGVTSYYGAFRKKGHEKVVEILENLGIKPYFRERGTLYYRRDLNVVQE